MGFSTSTALCVWLCSLAAVGCCKAFFILYIQYSSVWFIPIKNLSHVFLPYKENKLVKREKWRVTSGESYGCGSKEQLECLQCGSFFLSAIFLLFLGRTDTHCCCSQTPVQIPARDCSSIPAESTGGDLHRCNPLSLMSITRSISASETLPVLKLIIRSHSHNSSSKFYNWLILLLFGMYFWQVECLQTPLKSAGIRGAWQRERPFV